MKQSGITLKITVGTICLLASVATQAQLPEYVWAKQVGGQRQDGGDYGQSIAVDRAGNVYTVGEFRDTVYIPTGSQSTMLVSGGGTDVYLTKQTPEGAFIWAKSFGGVRDERANAIVVTDNGSLYITGQYTGTTDFDPGSGTEEHISTPNSRGTPGADFYISKFDTSGTLSWVKTGGNSGADAGTGIAIDKHSDDTLYVTGNIGAGDVDLDFGQGTVNLRNNGNSGSFVLKMGADGSITWGKVLGDASASSVSTQAIAVDLGGNVYTTGNYSSTADFDPDLTNSFTMTPVAKSDIFVSKLDASGGFVWAKSMGGDEVESGYSIVTDDNSNVYFTGSFQTTVNFDPNGTAFLYTLGGRDVFISKLDEAGNLVWAKHVGSATDDVGDGIALDDLGNVYTTGWFQSPRSEFNPGPNPEDTFNLVSYGSLDGFILKLDNDGGFVWAMNIGSNFGSEGSKAIAVDKGYIYTTGNFNSTANFDPAGPNLNQLTSNGGSDAFILKLKDCLPLSDQDILLSGAEVVCKGETYVYSVPPTPGVVNYEWILPDGWEGEAHNDSITVIANGPGTLRVIAYGLCDSTVISYPVDLDMNPVQIRVDGRQLSTTNAGEQAAWQWYLEGQEINGATDSILIVDVNGEYSVVVTGKNGCVDTAFYTVTNVTSIQERDLNSAVKLYPNPASEQVFIDAPEAVSVTLTSIDGRRLYHAPYDSVLKSIDLSGMHPGLYLVHIKSLNGALIKVGKLVITK